MRQRKRKCVGMSVCVCERERDSTPIPHPLSLSLLYWKLVRLNLIKEHVMETKLEMYNQYPDPTVSAQGVDEQYQPPFYLPIHCDLSFYHDFRQQR